VTGGDHRIGVAVLDQAHAHVDARVALPPHGGSGLLVHGDRLRRLDEADVGRPIGADERADLRFVTDQDDVRVGMAAGPVDAADDNLLRSVVAAHRVHRDAHPAANLSLAGAQHLEVHGRLRSAARRETRR
jgi:hypothetical protein